MDQEDGGVEKNVHVTGFRRYMGLRPWKRHSLILTVSGVLYAIVGFLAFVSEPSKTREKSLAAVLQFAPIEVWGCVFIFAGLLSALSSRWPPFAETWGYMVLTGLSAGWSSTYVMGILFFGAPAAGVSQALLWGVLAFMWWAISGLLNPDHTAVVHHE